MARRVRSSLVGIRCVYTRTCRAIAMAPEAPGVLAGRVATLRAKGWQADLICPAAPVRVEGRLPDGQPFNFRARHGEVSLGVGGADPADVPAWTRSRVLVGPSPIA
ncbi:hypothetical protein [Plantactinospora sonchi]|uniref:Uncharacterized protein n=1 Tax=Plantactinospora sonchi TaxID=1544735 RepID=A0ABU7S0D6_9ACTN